MTACPKPAPKVIAKRKAAATKFTDWRATRRDVLARDRYTCRACGKGGSLDVHHVVARSLGGKDVADNLIALCRACHRDVTAHVLWIRTNANQTVFFQRIT